MPLLFTYGNLLEGERNHSTLKGARMIGRGETTSGEWQMYNCGSYPAVLPKEGGGNIVGEIYEVKNLSDRVDFTREMVTVENEWQCWMYVWNKTKPVEEIFGNDWRLFRKRKDLERIWNRSPFSIENSFEVWLQEVAERWRILTGRIIQPCIDEVFAVVKDQKHH
jgi:gamma-glutamylcyclotransferase (GGCT)/AIG2-like uncharacterized protein YtfP